MLWRQLHKKGHVTDFFSIGHWSLVVNWHFMYYTSQSNCFKSWRHFFRERKGEVWMLETYTQWLGVLRHFPPEKAVNMLSLFYGESFYACVTPFFEYPFSRNPTPFHSSQVVLLVMMLLLQAGQFSSCICSSIRCFAFQSRELCGIRHHSNILSVLPAFGNISQSLDPHLNACYKFKWTLLQFPFE